MVDVLHLEILLDVTNSVNVDDSEVKTECIYSMEKMDINSQFSWLRE
jgi:hypothetical protein